MGIESPENVQNDTERSPNTIEVPIGFKTERGSNYEYFADGSGFVVRSKFDKSEHTTKGVTAFVDEKAMAEISKMYATQDHLPEERQKNYYLMEDLGTRGEYIWQTDRIENPANLIVAVVDGNNRLRAKYPASLTPEIGKYPFQQSIKDNAPNLHLGDKITEVDTSQSVVIKLKQ